MALARCEFDATDEAGNLLAAVAVEVRREDTGVLVPVYADRAGTVALGNPFAVTDGHVAFHAAGGAYKITLTQGAYSRVLRYRAIGLAAETDIVETGTLPTYTVATLPAASTAALMIYVNDESGGAVPAFSDGTNWRRFTDRAVVS